jgi:hypothetical protein
MISESIVIRRLQKERDRFDRELETEFIKGVRFGIALSMRVVKEIWEEVRARLLGNPWARRMFYNPIGGKRGHKTKHHHAG